MHVMEFVLFSATLKTSSALYVSNNFAWLLLLYKQSSIALSRLIEKKIMASFIQFHYKREVYCERTLQVQFPAISLL